MSAGTGMKEANAIEVEGLAFRYGRAPLLTGLSLSVPTGQTTALLGRNGAGKSTLLKLLMALLRPQEGRVRLLGLDPLRDATAVHERVGYVPDKPDAWPWMRVPDLFTFLAAHHPRWDEARARDWCARLDVPMGTPFKALSRGQGMKAMLAVTLAPDPDVLLLDEPFGGLDPVAREEVLKGLVGALGERRRAVLVSTHELDLAVRLGDRVALLEQGRIASEGTLSEVVGGEGVASADALRERLSGAPAGRGGA
jgi:ABC-2 type transport system ATP-binding protein